jgi:hypothetical protein
MLPPNTKPPANGVGSLELGCRRVPGRGGDGRTTTVSGEREHAGP